MNADVRVRSISFDASGSLPDPAAVTAARLYHDADEDGAVSDADFPLGEPATFPSDNGRITFSGLTAVLEANKPQRWIVSYALAPTAPAGTTFQLILTNAESVMAEFTNPIGLEAEATGSFAIHSADFTVGAGPPGQTFAAWQAQAFTPAQLADPNVSGPSADADLDKLPTILEYSFNLNPLVADRDTAPANDRGLPRAALVRAFDPATESMQDFLEITFVGRAAPADVLYLLEYSSDLQTWSNAEPSFLILNSSVEVGATLQRIRYRAREPVSDGGWRFVQVRVQWAAP